MSLRIEKLPALEAGFKNGLVDASGKKFKVVTSILSDVVSIRPVKEDYFYPTKTIKDSIVLHFTAGVLTGDISALTTNHVSVPYVVARDGTIYELFDPHYWAYHLGSSKFYGNQDRSSKTIGIEISNIGPLTLKDDGILYDIYNKGYCKLEDADFFNKVDYRGYHYFASYTEAQYASVQKLLEQLTEKFKIAYEFVAPEKRFEFSKSVPHKGIVTHANYRGDKFDLAPNFDFEKIQQVKS